MSKSKSKAPAIGIDLGTTNTCVAVWRNSRADIIVNDLGKRISPSCVAFTDTERFFGKPALQQRTKNPKNTVYDVKRLMGRRFEDPEVQEDMKRWPFTVVDVGGKPRIQVEYMKKTRKFAPEQISAMILRRIKETVDKFLDCDVKDAVITVPAYFNNAQRQATIDAGKIAGLNVLRIINEPTAAALEYGISTTLEKKRNVLIYDIGGGTFDVTIVSIEEGPKIQVLSTAGNTHLGGGDFDGLLVKFFAEKFKEKEKKDVCKNAKSLCKLTKSSEEAKMLLSSRLTTEVVVDALIDGIDFSPELTRAQFEEICSDSLKSTLDHVQKALNDAKLRKKDIDDVVLVGGSSRIPMVKQLLQDFFPGKSLKETINPDEAVANGAAVQAAILSGDITIKFKDIAYADVNSLSLGVKNADGSFRVAIPRNTGIPSCKTLNRVTHKDYQTDMEFRLYEGEKAIAEENHFLGKFSLYGIPPAPAGMGKVALTFNLDENCVLNITAVEKITRESNSLKINMKESCMSETELNDAIEELEILRREELENAVLARN